MNRCQRNGHAPMRCPFLNPPPSPPRHPRRRAPTAKVGRPNVRPSPKTSAGGKGGDRAPKRDQKVVTFKATTTPDGGDSSAEKGPRGRALEPPAPGPRGAPAGHEGICVSSASSQEPRGEGGAGYGGGGRFVIGARPRQGVGGSKPPSAGYPGHGEKTACGSCPDYASAADDACAGGSGGWGGRGKRTCQRGCCWSNPECVRGGASGWRGGVKRHRLAGTGAVRGGAGAGGVVAGPQAQSRSSTASG